MLQRKGERDEQRDFPGALYDLFDAASRGGRREVAATP